MFLQKRVRDISKGGVFKMLLSVSIWNSVFLEAGGIPDQKQAVKLIMISKKVEI